VKATVEVSYMTWTKPKFEIIDLCSEVTSYLYKRLGEDRFVSRARR
jgi:coenzyme PQQ precursor peptide PqqA